MTTITITLTAVQLNTVERALNDYAYDLQENFHRNESVEDELRLVQEALDVIQPALLASAWDKTKYETWEDWQRSLGADY